MLLGQGRPLRESTQRRSDSPLAKPCGRARRCRRYRRRHPSVSGCQRTMPTNCVGDSKPRYRCRSLRFERRLPNQTGAEAGRSLDARPDQSSPSLKNLHLPHSIHPESPFLVCPNNKAQGASRPGLCLKSALEADSGLIRRLRHHRHLHRRRLQAGVGSARASARLGRAWAWAPQGACPGCRSSGFCSIPRPPRRIG